MPQETSEKRGVPVTASPKHHLDLTVDKLVALTAALENLNKLASTTEGIRIERAQFGDYAVELQKIGVGADTQYQITGIWLAPNKVVAGGSVLRSEAGGGVGGSVDMSQPPAAPRNITWGGGLK